MPEQIRVDDIGSLGFCVFKIKEERYLVQPAPKIWVEGLSNRMKLKTDKYNNLWNTSRLSLD